MARVKQPAIQTQAPRVISASPVSTYTSAGYGGTEGQGYAGPITRAAPVASTFFDRRSNNGGSAQFESANAAKNAAKLAETVKEKSAGIVKLNEYGMPETPLSKNDTQFTNNLSSISRRGVSATGTEVAKNQWQELKRMQDLAYGYNPDNVNYSIDLNMPTAPSYNLDLPPGSTPDNPGGRAVALALQAYKNKTPYKWGGNSLVTGVDCSGLVQQVYAKLGVSIPRSTYNQAKSGKVVPLNSLLPGDLIFYNTGSRDPNGIGVNSHVALYIGNGMIVDARNTRSGIKRAPINEPGQPSTAVRPW